MIRCRVFLIDRLVHFIGDKPGQRNLIAAPANMGSADDFSFFGVGDMDDPDRPVTRAIDKTGLIVGHGIPLFDRDGDRQEKCQKT